LIKVQNPVVNSDDSEANKSSLEFKRKAKKGTASGSTLKKSNVYGEASSNLAKNKKETTANKPYFDNYDTEDKDLDLIMKYSSKNLTSKANEP
jgi:hypothetical protein